MGSGNLAIGQQTIDKCAKGQDNQYRAEKKLNFSAPTIDNYQSTPEPTISNGKKIKLLSTEAQGYLGLT